jgi:hypothetical protein
VNKQLIHDNNRLKAQLKHRDMQNDELTEDIFEVENKFKQIGNF